MTTETQFLRIQSAMKIDSNFVVVSEGFLLLTNGIKNDQDMSRYKSKISELKKRARIVVAARRNFTREYKEEIRAAEKLFNSHARELTDLSDEMARQLSEAEEASCFIRLESKTKLPEPSEPKAPKLPDLETWKDEIGGPGS